MVEKERITIMHRYCFVQLNWLYHDQCLCLEDRIVVVEVEEMMEHLYEIKCQIHIFRFEKDKLFRFGFDGGG